MRRGLTGCRRWIRSAPATYTWLAIIAVTTAILLPRSDRVRDRFLRAHSTDVHELQMHPLRVLVASALWTSGPLILVYAVLFTIFLAPAERWLGTPRWLVVVVAGHLGATLISEGGLAGRDSLIWPR
ncbi:MAG: rhomboid-like protein [Mycobacteriales bacterium]